VAEYALRLENSTDTRERMRKGDAIGLTPGSVSGARNGLRSDGGGVVSAVVGTMTVEVTPFRAWVDGGASDAQGGYPFVLDATKVLTVTDGDAVLSRTDTVVAEVLDDTYDGSGSTVAQVRVVAGTPGAGAPTLPATCVALRDVTVPAGLSAGTGGLSSSNIGTDRRVYTAALGGIVPVSGATERDAMGAELGQPVYRLDTGNLQVFNGSDWDTYTATTAKGRVSSAAGSQNLADSTTIEVNYTAVDYSEGVTASAAGNSLTVDSDAVYRLTTGGSFGSGSSTGRRILILKKNGTEVTRETYNAVAPAAADVTLTWEGALVAGDEITVDAFHDSGSTRTFGGYLALSEV